MSLWWSRCNIYRLKNVIFLFFLQFVYRWNFLWFMKPNFITDQFLTSSHSSFPESWSGLGGVACSEVTSHVIGCNWNRVLYIQLQNLATSPHGLDIKSSVLGPYCQSPAGPRWASAGSCPCRQVYHHCRHRSHTRPLCHPCRGRPGWR